MIQGFTLARDVLQTVTAGGTETVGFDRGIIKPGKRASSTVLDDDSGRLLDRSDLGQSWDARRGVS